MGRIALTKVVLGTVGFLGRLVFAAGLARWVIRARSRHPRVLLYHACAPEVGTHLAGLRSNTPPDRFEAQLDFLARHYNVVDLAGALASDRPPAAVAITFDDGYRSVYEHAFPALRARQFPAQVYLISSAVGDGTMVWVNAVNDLLARSPAAYREAAAVASLGSEPEDLLGHLVAELPAADVPNLVARMASAADLDPITIAEDVGLFLTPEQIAEMADAGITFANHTVHHLNLVRCGDDQARNEVIGAHRALKDTSGFVPSLAYPFGAVSGAARAAAIELGYTSIVEVGGVNTRLDPFAVARQPVAEHTPAELFAEMEFLEPFKAWVRARLRV